MINNIVKEVLDKNGRVSIEGIGYIVKSVFDGEISYMFKPSAKKIDDNLLNAVMENMGVDNEEAESLLDYYTEFISKRIVKKGKYTLTGVGDIFRNEQSVYYLLPVSEEIDEDDDEELTTIQNFFLKNKVKEVVEEIIEEEPVIEEVIVEEEIIEEEPVIEEVIVEEEIIEEEPVIEEVIVEEEIIEEEPVIEEVIVEEEIIEEEPVIEEVIVEEEIIEEEPVIEEVIVEEEIIEEEPVIEEVIVEEEIIEEEPVIEEVIVEEEIVEEEPLIEQKPRLNERFAPRRLGEAIEREAETNRFYDRVQTQIEKKTQTEEKKEEEVISEVDQVEVKPEGPRTISTESAKQRKLDGIYGKRFTADNKFTSNAEEKPVVKPVDRPIETPKKPIDKPINKNTKKSDKDIIYPKRKKKGADWIIVLSILIILAAGAYIAYIYFQQTGLAL